MTQPYPSEIADLLAANDPAASGAAWARFLERHSGLLIQAARSFGSGYDQAMDRYQYVIEELARDDFRRIRAFSPAGPGKFSTWLVVVTQRLCRDYHRKRFGRLRATSEDSKAVRARAIRWRLEELIAEELDPDLTGDQETEDPESALRQRELRTALHGALAGLDRRDRLLLRYRFQDDRSLSDIAGLMHFPSVFHVYRRLRRITGRLRAELERRGIDSPIP